MWRELHRNMKSDDVLAVQRGLWSYLGTRSQNIRNGIYGQGTCIDVSQARARLGLTSDPNTIGQLLFDAIWDSMDVTARRLYCNQPIACPTPSPRPKRIPLTKGMTGDDVKAVQRALWRALGEDSTNSRNGNYGPETVADVKRFRAIYQVNAADPGTKIGGDLYDVLTRFMDTTAVKLVEAYTPPPPKPPANLMEQALQSALSQVGYQEGSGNANKFGAWYGFDRVSWCAEFVTWAAEQHDSQTFDPKASRYAWCPSVVADAQSGRNGLRVVSRTLVTPGMLALFDWGHDGVADHIEIVLDPPGSDVVFVDVGGNTSGGQSGSQSNGDGVYRRTRYLSDVVLFASYQ